MKTFITCIVISMAFLWVFDIAKDVCKKSGVDVAKCFPILSIVTLLAVFSPVVALILWIWGIAP